MTIAPGPGLAIAIVLLVGVAIAASAIGHLRQERAIGVAALRAVVQLAAVSLVIAAALSSLLWSAVVVVVMFLVAALTSAHRVGALRRWPWVALAMAAGLTPTLTVIFVSGAVPFTGAALVPVVGIIIGGAMMAHTLVGMRAFGTLRERHGAYEAALSLGMSRAEAISEVVADVLPEALVPGQDQTRTVGLVTLPGAYIGVLLGGGSALQAGAAQVLVLLGLVAAQTVTVVVAHLLIRSGRLLPADLRERLRP
ncbi:ABC transporter permease [Ruania alba]|uniref:Putative ABC transport system permease protein n=1 Tax=Ruania alba TaxID=648782 RepID=A0A1H5LBA5_9MICO|nr:ABC transporter permease [Ruania alba]SEE74333.1 putative ABC transport system permease protein [Ruania alba]